MKEKFKYPLWGEAIANGNYVVEFTGITTGTVVKLGPTRTPWPLGETGSDWFEHTDASTWKLVDNPNKSKVKFIV